MNEQFAFLNPAQAELAAAVPKVNTAQPKSAEPPFDPEQSWKSNKDNLAYYESRNNPNAVGKSNDVGLFQITPIAVEEANRVMNRNKNIDVKSPNFVTYFKHSEMFDPSKNEQVARVLWLENLKQFQLNMGRNPTNDEAIMMHNRPTYYKFAQGDKVRNKAEQYLTDYNTAMAKKPVKLVPITGTAKKEEKPKPEQKGKKK